MSNYKQYADRANAAFLEAREKYMAAYTAYKEAEQERADFQKVAGSAILSGENHAERERRRVRLESRYQDAKKALQEVHETVFPAFLRQFDAIGKECMQELKTSGAADPTAIDGNTMALLNSGILNPVDVSALIDRHSDNATMLRMLRKYALSKGGENNGHNADSYEFNTLAAKAKEMIEGTVEGEWNKLHEWAELCSGNYQYPTGAKSPDYVADVAAMWENRTGSIIENF